MRKLSVYVEVCGRTVCVGTITGKSSEDARFAYLKGYSENPESRAISISLPLTEKEFDPLKTKNFFEGLLPEGFTRKCVAQSIRADVNDYLTILSSLGNECLGAIKILDDNDQEIKQEYRLLTDREVKNLAREGASKSAQLVTKAHLSLTGASGKVGLYYDEKDERWYLPIGDAPSTHIVKQSHVRLKNIVANEQLCLLTAKYLGIEVPESFIIDAGNSGDEDVLFATKRYDRIQKEEGKKINHLIVPYRLHQEDFAQALGVAASSKYEKENERYLKKLFDVLKNYSSDPITDQMKLWDICVFNYLVGNTDNHIKNLSLLYGDNLKTIRLAPAYDILSTIIYESSTENMALSIDGKYQLNEINRESFINEAEYIGLGSRIAMKRFDELSNGFETALKRAASELKEQGFREIEMICEKVLNKGGISIS